MTNFELRMTKKIRNPKSEIENWQSTIENPFCCLDFPPFLWYNFQMRYKVPQDVQREDQILWFITLRQLIMLLIGFGISYMIFSNMKDKYELDTVAHILIWFPAAIAAAFAFLKIKGIPLAQFILLIVEHLFFRFPKRYWIQQGGEPFVSLTTRISSLTKKKEEVGETKVFSKQKARELAKFLDGQKSDIAKAKPKNA